MAFGPAVRYNLPPKKAGGFSLPSGLIKMFSFSVEQGAIAKQKLLFKTFHRALFEKKIIKSQPFLFLKKK